MKSRTFLKGAGVVTVLVVGGGVWRGYDQGVFSTGTGSAYEPRKNWRSDKSEGPVGWSEQLFLPLVRTTHSRGFSE